MDMLNAMKAQMHDHCRKAFPPDKPHNVNLFLC